MLYCVYDHPADYPDKFVARAWTTDGGPTDSIIQADTLDELRAHKATDMIILPRSPQDDPVIAECWYDGAAQERSA